MSGARAALRVENRVAVRVRALISTLASNLEAVEPYSARSRLTRRRVEEDVF